MELTGRVALVTGASSGIGEAIALSLAERGAAVALVARRADELERVQALITGAGGQAVAIPADLTAQGAVGEAVHTAQAALGPIDILVNNAAAAKTADVRELSARRWDLGLRLNLTVPFLAAREVLAGMRERGYGWVVNIGSVGGLQPHAHSAPYSVGKNALNLLTEVIDLENRHLGVRAVAICPGWVRTAMALDPALVGVDESELLTAKDIAETVCWILGRPPRMAVGPIVPVVPTSQNTDVTRNWERFLRDVLNQDPDPADTAPPHGAPDDAAESLAGRVALVTGASSGIGEAIALSLAQRGAAVALVARRPDELERVRARIADAGSRTVAIPADLSADGAIEEAIHTAQAALGPIDILVSNAGIARIAPVHRLSVRQWDLALRLNATVPFLAARLLLPGMRERGYGRIVNISSDGASQAYACSAPYSVSKRALNVLTEVIDLENRHLGVRAVAICPGWVRTAMALDPALVGVDESELLTPQDIADTVVWHVLRPARMTAGPVIPVVPVSQRTSTAVSWRRSLETPQVQRALAVERTPAHEGARR